MKLYQVEPNKVILRDYLARDRTMLANERTFLSFIRTSIGTFGSGIVCVKILDDQAIILLGAGLMIISPFVFVYGLYRYMVMRRKLLAIPDNDLLYEPRREMSNDTDIHEYSIRSEG